MSGRNPVTLETGYERKKFGHGWDDTDGDCQNSRAEALIASSTSRVRFSDPRRCRVASGRWISPFTGQVIQNASDIDIDHVVPLKWAWEHGAKDWSEAKRETFANDMNNLWSVELSLNRQKGAKGPEHWLPPQGQCQYVSRFVRLIKTYNLRPSSNQLQHYKRLLARHC
ncbi:HNH endonuclease family protein [Marinobacter sp. chi1]|uniref:HNH endonuclease family protein n=1 Tax=Marinobacter suaedae TaxID=3057675 RepID=A0ABT8W3A6_9GAMM|nr:HNH endonuclease family protein [Marinobacter sp. chi1]MDO3722717.1 HNH endonuclease family protein [Marinobacter sp. chi1]